MILRFFRGLFRPPATVCWSDIDSKLDQIATNQFKIINHFQHIRLYLESNPNSEILINQILNKYSNNQTDILSTTNP